MKTVTFDMARDDFEQMFQLAAGGETVVIQRAEQRVALHRLSGALPIDVAPPGYFADDYSPEEVAELNTLASQAPRIPLP
jgi:hypothetical protein